MMTRILIIDQVRSESLSFRRMNDEASPHVKYLSCEQVFKSPTIIRSTLINIAENRRVDFKKKSYSPTRFSALGITISPRCNSISPSSCISFNAFETLPLVSFIIKAISSILVFNFFSP